MNRYDNRLNIVEKRINRLEDRSDKNILIKQFSVLLVSLFFWKLLSVRNIENTEEKKNWVEIMFEEIIIKVFLKMMQYAKPQIQVIL